MIYTYCDFCGNPIECYIHSKVTITGLLEVDICSNCIGHVHDSILYCREMLKVEQNDSTLDKKSERSDKG